LFQRIRHTGGTSVFKELVNFVEKGEKGNTEEENRSGSRAREVSFPEAKRRFDSIRKMTGTASFRRQKRDSEEGEKNKKKDLAADWNFEQFAGDGAAVRGPEDRKRSAS